MNRPTATYRLQFRNGMTFGRALDLVPYLNQLGISHLYASPIFTAAPGSTHGYDVIDFSGLERSLGGEDEFGKLIGALKHYGLSLIIDFVPNHMGSTPYNPWWRDVLEWGARSDYAQHFDIDWTAPKLVVPALAAGYGKELDEGKFGLVFDVCDGGIFFSYGQLKLPLTPPSYAQLFTHLKDESFVELTRRFAVSTPEVSQSLKKGLADLARNKSVHLSIKKKLEDTSSDRNAIHELHEAQVWQLAHWRAARETLNYRRFFEIADLVGLRVESNRVFEDVHMKLLNLIKKNCITGVRLDHIDGLADPKSYLKKLQTEANGKKLFYIIVEKILGPNEELRQDWPVAGTTGYEFIRSLGNLLVDSDGVAIVTEAYHRYIGQEIDYPALVLDNKRKILSRNLAGELAYLKEMAISLAERDYRTRDFGPDTLRRAIVELAAALPVYRTYVDVSGPSDTDRKVIEDATQSAVAAREVEDQGALHFISRILLLEFISPDDQASALEFTTRFQQTTGPVMAKALEDTVFYQYNRFIGLNEVGGQPEQFGAPPEAFHDEMFCRQVRQPLGLSATSTHDTKRGEDTRARLYTLSELSNDWFSAVTRWTKQNAHLHRDTKEHKLPDPETEWLYYQTLLGAWPLEQIIKHEEKWRDFQDRMTQFMLKAVREAKVYTSWTDQNSEYEETIEIFVRNTLDPSISGQFLEDFSSTCQPIFVAGALNGLTLTLLKLMAPGVPDLYQGSELWDFSLVDPDNRRPVDFDRRSRLLNEIRTWDQKKLLSDWPSGAIKMRLLMVGLAYRKRCPELFSDGAYLPLRAENALANHVVAFARCLDGDAAIAVAPRLVSALLSGQTQSIVPPDIWEDTCIVLPEQLSGKRWLNLTNKQTINGETSLRLSEILNTFPVALLKAESCQK